MAKLNKKPVSEDYDLDGIRHLNLTEDAILNHKRTRRIMHNLELTVIISVPTIAAVTAVGYGVYLAGCEIYGSIPQPVKETINDLYTNLYQFLSQLPS